MALYDLAEHWQCQSGQASETTQIHTPLVTDQEDRLQLQGKPRSDENVDAVEMSDTLAQATCPARMQSAITVRTFVTTVHLVATGLLEPWRKTTLFSLILSLTIASQLGPPKSSSTASK